MQSLEALSGPAVPLTSVIATSELRRRPRRAPDLEAESQALTALAQAFGASRQSTLQKLSEIALDLCRAHSAGITLLEESGTEPVLRWRALAGKFAPHVGATMPRSFSPCGTTLDNDAVQLMSRPVQHFPFIDAWAPAIEEALLTPFRVNGTALGTIWVVSHDDSRRFDAEDARLLMTLSKFATVGCELTRVSAYDESGRDGKSATLPTVTASDNKERFMAILAHELRGRLQPAKTAAEALKRETLDAATRRSLAEIIERQIVGMTRLVDDLLDVARLQAGALRLRRTRADAAEIIEQAVEAAQPFLAARNHTLVVSLPPQRVFLEADVLWLAQALQNLLGNAAKYTNSNGTIRISAQRENDQFVITVSDSGLGISAAELDTIFDLYAQAGQAGTERAAGGVGLGLYVARLVVEGHGGVILASSPGVGGGSQFVVRLPLLDC